jgi:hypothetical protein
MSEFKQLCIQLREKDYTLNEIVQITGKPKTSVYFHIHKIPLSEKKQIAIRKASGARIRPFALLRRGKSDKPFIPFTEWNSTKVLLVAHLLFDGEIKHGGCVYNNRNTALIKRVERCMKEVYTFPPTRYSNTHTGVLRINYFNVALSAYVRTKADELLLSILKFPLAFKRNFLKAFFDDEGCIDYREHRKTRRIRGYQKEQKNLKLIQSLLLAFGIETKLVFPNEIVISGKDNLAIFQKEINFSKGVRINGNRSNSIWKKSLEKREILDRAIHSFQ